MLINFRKVLLGVLFGTLIASSAQAGHFSNLAGGLMKGAMSGASKISHAGGGLTQSVRKLAQPASGGMQALKSKVTQTLAQPGRPSLSTMNLIKGSNALSGVKQGLLNHGFNPSTLDVVKASNALSSVKQGVLSHGFNPSTLDVIKASNALSSVKQSVLSHGFNPSTLNAIKGSNALTDVKSVLSHAVNPATLNAIAGSNTLASVKQTLLNPSTMDVIKASNALSDIKQKVLNPSTMDVIKASNALNDLKTGVLGQLNAAGINLGAAAAAPGTTPVTALDVLNQIGTFAPAALGALAQIRGGGGGGGGFDDGSGGGGMAPDFSQAAEEPAPQVAQEPAPVAAPADPVIYTVEPMQGAERQLVVRGDNFGSQTGQVTLQVGDLTLGLDATAWTSNAIVVKLPTLQTPPQAAVHLTAMRTDGAASQPYDPAGR